MTPIVGFAPDMESPTPGVLTDCAQFIPYESGMEAAPSGATPSDVPVLAAACLGAAVVSKLDASRRTIAGTATKLYELSGGTWTDVSGATYSAGADTRWSFAQFGDTTLAANKGDAIQSSTSGAFAAISGAPKADIIFTVGSFVMAMNVDDGAAKLDGWHCCASFDETDWTENVATQSASGRLVATPGPLTAGGRLGEYAVAYKATSLYLGQYVGAPAVWDWIPIQGAGCVGKDALCDVDGLHFFVGQNNFWLFDGTRPQPVGDMEVRQWFYENSNPAYLSRCKCVYDRKKNRVWVFYPSTSSEVCDSALVYHVKTKRWGRAAFDVEAAVIYVTGGVTINGLDSISGTIDGLTTISMDSPYWTSGDPALAVFNDSHQLQTLTGAAGVSSMTTGDFGDDETVTLLQGIRLRFASGVAPAVCSATAYWKMNSGDSYETGETTNLVNGRLDVLQSARWHKAAVQFSGDTRVTGLAPRFTAQGDQ